MARETAHRLIRHFLRHHERARTPTGERGLRRQQDDSTQRVHGTITLPSTRFLQSGRLRIANATLRRGRQPDDLLATTCAAEFEVGRRGEPGEIDRRRVDELESLIRDEMRRPALVRPHRRTGEEHRTLHAKGEAIRRGERTPVHGAKRIRYRHRVGLAGLERPRWCEADGHGVAPFQSPGNGRLHAKNRRGVHGSVERAGHWSIERDSDPRRDGRVRGGCDADDAEDRGRLRERDSGAGQRQREEDGRGNGSDMKHRGAISLGGHRADQPTCVSVNQLALPDPRHPGATGRNNPAPRCGDRGDRPRR